MTIDETDNTHAIKINTTSSYGMTVTNCPIILTLPENAVLVSSEPGYTYSEENNYHWENSDSIGQ